MKVWNDKKNLIILSGLVTLTVCLLSIQLNTIRKEKWERDKKEYLFEQQQLKQEMEPLMKEAKEVMRGEKTATGELALYNFQGDGWYENIVSIDADVNIIVAEINGNKGSLVVEYYIHRFDKSGKKVSWSESDACVWHIAKEDDKWILAEVPDPIGGARDEARRLMTKMYEFGEIQIAEEVR